MGNIGNKLVLVVFQGIQFQCHKMQGIGKCADLILAFHLQCCVKITVGIVPCGPDDYLKWAIDCKNKCQQNDQCQKQQKNQGQIKSV